MRIISIRPSLGGSRTLAHLDLEVGGLKLFDIELKRAADGTLRAWPPHRGKRAVAAISADLAGEISKAAMAVLEGRGLVES